MSEVLPNNPHDPNAPDPEARSPVSHSCARQSSSVGRSRQSRSLQAIRRPYCYLQPTAKRGFTLERGGRTA